VLPGAAGCSVGVEDHVVEAVMAQEPGAGQSRLSGADHDDVDVPHTEENNRYPGKDLRS